MKEQVTDILNTLKSLIEKVSSMEQQIDDMHATICNNTRTIERLTKENRELKKRLAKYEEPPKNSGNSSTPPSKERIVDEIIRRTKTTREKSGKKVGGQPGHDGKTSEMSAHVDEEINIDPNYCTKCGESLADSERVIDFTTQVISIPELKPIISNVNHYICICKHCARVQSHAKRKHGGNPVIYDKCNYKIISYKY